MGEEEGRRYVEGKEGRRNERDGRTNIHTNVRMQVAILSVSKGPQRSIKSFLFIVITTDNLES